MKKYTPADRFKGLRTGFGRFCNGCKEAIPVGVEGCCDDEDIVPLTGGQSLAEEQEVLY